MRLKDKVAIVTGGGRGIGRGIALAYAREGADVVVADVSPQHMESVANEIRALGRCALACRADVSDRAQVEALVRTTVEQFGHLDILVNNAGIARQAAVVDMKDEDWDTTMAINAKGVFLCSQYAARQMLKQGKGGRIINISSYSGKVGQPYCGAYCASKFAVVGLTQSMARELASSGINVNAICPGRIDTEMMAKTFEQFAESLGITVEESRRKLMAEISAGRLGTIAEVAELAVFLACEQSSYITAQAININGGMDAS